LSQLQIDAKKFTEFQLKLKAEYASKVAELLSTIEDQQKEVDGQKELIEQADNLLNDFNNEKHDIKAKFKHLMQLIAHNNASAAAVTNLLASTTQDDGVPPTISSYKGREDEVDLNACFVELEGIVLNQKSTMEDRISQLVQDNQTLDNQVKQQQKDLDDT